jgi:hypothetical protein
MFREPSSAALLWAAALTACFPGEIRDRHAAVVEDYAVTPFVDPGQPFADAGRSLGPPDGRTVALGRGAYVTLRFFREIPDGEGPDLRIYEVGADGAEARVAVSEDGDQFIELDTIVAGTTTELDFADTGLPGISFVRVRGLDDVGIEPGFDLDALEALH